MAGIEDGWYLKPTLRVGSRRGTAEHRPTVVAVVAVVAVMLPTLILQNTENMRGIRCRMKACCSLHATTLILQNTENNRDYRVLTALTYSDHTHIT